MSHEFRTIQGSPCPKLIAPYIAIVVNDARATVNSIYRGDDARAILNAHGKHSQTQLYEMFLSGQGAPANRPGTSTHELKSDGNAFPRYPRGADLPWWCQGFDVNDSDTDRVIEVAKRYGWTVFRPYSSGVERHHLDFKFQPSGHSLGTRMRIARLRATLPHR